MKKKILLFIMIFVLFDLSASDYSKFYMGLDLAYLDPFYSNIFYNQIDTQFHIASDLDISIPINLIIPKDKAYDCFAFGGSINLNYRPFKKSLFLSFSMIEVEYFFNSDAPQERLQYLNHIALGYSFFLNENFIIEPSFIFFNPSGVYDLSIFKDSLGGFSPIRFSLIVNYKIFEFANEKNS